MWDRSLRWQRLARMAAGGAACAALFVGLGALSTTEAAGRARAGVAEISRESQPDADSRVLCTVPTTLAVRPGVLVYRELPDGSGEIVGRVIGVRGQGAESEVTVLLTPTAAGAMARGGKLRAAEPTLSVEHAFRLLISPEIPRDEAGRARDAIWPAIEKHILPGLKERLTREVTHSFDQLDPEDAELLNATMADLRTELAPMEQELLNKLANRAWEVIGVSGVAEGVLRKASDGAENTYNDVKDWVKGWWEEKKESESVNRDFLSEEKATALRIALEEEVETYLKEHENEIKEKLNKVSNNRRAEFIQQFETKWGPKLYENAVVPAWLEGEDGVLEAAEQYAEDFARRRLLTDKGGPRLLLAYALRSSLEITSDPLLVIAPDQSGRVQFEWIMPRLEKDGR